MVERLEGRPNNDSWYVGGGDLTGALPVLDLLAPLASSSLAAAKFRMVDILVPAYAR